MPLRSRMSGCIFSFSSLDERPRGSCWRRVVWALCGLALVWLWSPAAMAWVQTKTTGAQKPMSWHKMPIQYAVDADGMGDYFTKNPNLGTPQSEFAAVDFSFKVWADILCPSGGPVGLRFQSLGRVSGKQVGFDPNCDNCNTNLVKFVRTGWTRSSTELAAAINAFRDLSGEIFDSDILVNAEHFPLSTQDTSPETVQWDIQNAVTHEVGHLLGLSHTDVAEATMYAQSGLGNLQLRDLHEDDVAGICTIYPPQQVTGKVPQYIEGDKGRGLNCSTTGQPQPTWMLWLLGLIGLRLWRRQAKASHPNP